MAAVLAILGLSGVLPTYILPVAGIVLGTAFLTLGTTTSSWARMFTPAATESSRQRTVFLSGVAAVSLAGLAAIVYCGILNFAFLGDLRFSGVAVIALGLGLLWHSLAMSQVSHLLPRGLPRGGRTSPPKGCLPSTHSPWRRYRLPYRAWRPILGILAMMNVVPAVLEFVGLLIFGMALSVTASTICGASLAAVKSIYSKR